MDDRFHAAEAALAAGNVERMDSLLKADPDLATARSRRSHPTILQCLVLTMPPVDAQEELIAMLAAHGAELTEPLIAASSMNNVRAIEQLLDLGARIEGNGCWSPLEEALYWGHAEAVSILIERGAPVENLRTAAALGDLERVAECFDDRGDLSEAAGEVAWPFYSAIGAIPADVRRDRQHLLGNALVYAAAWGQAEVVELLIAHGARVSFIPAGFDFSGTALHYAALQGRREMVDLLLSLGADPDIRDTKIGKLPEDWAEHDGHEAISEHLRWVRRHPG